MTTDLQTIAALAVVAITAIWMIAHAVSKRSKPGCGGCPSEKKSRVPKGWKI
jgi:hypothetical protein